MDNTPIIMRRFQRYYPKLQKVMHPTGDEHTFGFRIINMPAAGAAASADGDPDESARSKGEAQEAGTSAVVTGPAEDRRMRLAVVMRRFFNPSDDLYYVFKWDELKTHF